jgi:hypothetical protein
VKRKEFNQALSDELPCDYEVCYFKGFFLITISGKGIHDFYETAGAVVSVLSRNMQGQGHMFPNMEFRAEIQALQTVMVALRNESRFRTTVIRLEKYYRKNSKKLGISFPRGLFIPTVMEKEVCRILGVK